MTIIKSSLVPVSYTHLDVYKRQKARKQAVTGENESAEAIEKLDQILKGIYDNAVKQQAE